VCFSNKKTRKWQEPNLQEKKVYWEQGQRWVRLKICTRAIKTLGVRGEPQQGRAAQPRRRPADPQER
jgi:ribosomal protein L28